MAYLPLSIMQPTLTPTFTPTPLPTNTPVPVPTGVQEPNDPLYNKYQWGLHIMWSNQAWSISTGQAIGVPVAVIDSGVDYTHPDLANRMVAPALWYDFGDNDSDPMDADGHGTHVAGSIGAQGNNGQGITGVNWNAYIMPFKVARSDGAMPYSAVTAAIYRAADQGARVINMSLGGPSYSQAMQDAIHYARSRGVVVVAAMGNCHQVTSKCPVADEVSYPAALDGVIGVAATNLYNNHSYYSSVGIHADVAAAGGEPGQDIGTSIVSTFPRHIFSSGYAGSVGTSMASPHVAGLASLLIDMRPSLTPDEVEFILEATAEDRGSAGWDPFYGYGIINMRRAMESVWYMNHPALTTLASEAPRALPAPTLRATSCDQPHASDRLILNRQGVATAKAQALLQSTTIEPLYELPTWQVVTVPDGDACALMQALNRTAQGQVVAELDVLILPTPFEPLELP